MDTIIDYENINAIDMECNVLDDDDDSMVLKNSDNETSYDDENRPLQTKTGIMIDLSDDDSVDIKKIVVNAEPEKSELKQIRNFNTTNIDNVDLNDYNGIDMECSIGEDDDEFGDVLVKNSKEDEYPDTIGLIDSDMITEKKSVNQGEVEKDYLKKLQLKHQKANTKGSYNTHFHFAGDPKAEMDMFNHDMNTSGVTSLSGALGDSSAPAFSAGGDAGSGCCENLNEDFSNKMNEMLLIIGFDVIKNSDNTYTLIDLCRDDVDFKCQSKDEVLKTLQPYIDDCFIIPLQIETNKQFKSCKEFSDWYDDNAKKEFPNCSSDIEYCNLLANHWNDIDF